MNDAGRIGFVTRGEYNNTETYDFLDVVYYGNSSYVAKKLTVGNTPADNNEYWQALAKVPVSAVLVVKGNAESAYRTGNVNLTAANVGAVAKSGDTMTGELTANGGIKYAGRNNYIAYPDDGYLDTPNDHTNNLGFLRVTLPVSWTTTMLKFVVSIYDYFTGEATDYHLSGYTYGVGNTWISCTATCVGKAGAHHSNLPVSFGHDGTNCAITIGNANTSWHYPIVKVHDILLGRFESDFSKWKTGWNISVNTTPLPTVNVTVENTHVAYGGISSSCTGNAASATKATQDGNGNVIASTYVEKNWKNIGRLNMRGGHVSIDITDISDLSIIISGSIGEYWAISKTYTIPAQLLSTETTTEINFDAGDNEDVLINKSYSTLIIYNNTFDQYVDVYAR